MRVELEILVDLRRVGVGIFRLLAVRRALDSTGAARIYKLSLFGDAHVNVYETSLIPRSAYGIGTCHTTISRSTVVRVRYRGTCKHVTTVTTNHTASQTGRTSIRCGAIGSPALTVLPRSRA